MQFEERNFQHQFSVSADKLYEWNIDGLSEQEVLNKLSHLSMVANSYMTNHQLTHIEIIDLLVTGFSGKLKSWWEKHLTKESRDQLKILLRRMKKVTQFSMKELGWEFLMELIPLSSQ